MKISSSLNNPFCKVVLEAETPEESDYLEKFFLKEGFCDFVETFFQL